MNPDQVSTVFALLAIAAGVGAIAVGVVQLVWRGTERLDDLRREQWPNALLGAALVALVSMFGSLYLSEVAHFPPCMWCWYQRIAMYPLGVILLLAWWRRDAAVKPYALLIACIGALISTYHVVLEVFPTLESDACLATVPCSVSPVSPLGGALTVPRMALCGFVAVIAALSLVRTPPVQTAH